MMFKDRREAGVLLAAKLQEYRSEPGLVVFGIPRGGVAVADEVARELRAPLEAVIVRKLGVPGFPEVAMGAIAAGGVILKDDKLIKKQGISRADVASVIRREMKELRRREKVYREGNPPLELQGKTVILVDDGIATSHTMRAALLSLRRRNPARLVVAVPICASQAYRWIIPEADDVVCFVRSDEFGGISEWYDDFEQVTDEEVVSILRRSRSPSNPGTMPIRAS